ncbi:MAG: porin family protein [Bacteroidota bacterium]|nr:porin family protein [Bacteroidota bacterium]MDP4224941.1 porin family protein [Bacteroidota bacterium]MDP4274110.1 porin family protein [Bacteroidota bacterium]
MNRGWLIVVFILLPLSMQAQRFKGGIIAGISASQVDGDNYSGYNKAGFIFGGFVNTKVSEKSGLQLELKYIGKGSHKPSTISDPAEYKMRLHYVELPLKFFFEFNHKFKFDGGPAVAYLISHNEEDENGAIQPEKDFHHFELSVNAGMGYTITKRIDAHIGYSYSIFPIRGLPTNYTRKRYNGQYNNLFTLTVYYRIGRD